MKKNWVNLGNNITIEVSGVRSVNGSGSSPYIYIKFVGERKPVGYGFKDMETKKQAQAKLDAALEAMNTDQPS